MLRQRKVYSPVGRPGSTAAQWAFVSRIGQLFGTPAPSKPCVPTGMMPSGRALHFVGAGSNSASTHGAVRKSGSASECGAACDSTHTKLSAVFTFRPEDNPPLPDSRSSGSPELLLP